MRKNRNAAVRGRPSYAHLPANPDIDETQTERICSAITALAAASSPANRTCDFFRDCVRHLATAYRTKFAFIGVFADDEKTKIQTRAVCADGEIVDNFTYDLAATPCNDVMDTGSVFIPDSVAAAYPDDELLVEMGLESYFGTTLIVPSGEVIGLVVVTDVAPMKKDPWVDPVLGLFADRIAFELERETAEQNTRLAASVFGGSNEAIMIYGRDLKICAVNDAFTKITGWARTDIEGQPTTVMCSHRHDEAFYGEIDAALERDGHWEGEVWTRNQAGGVFPAQLKVDAVRDAASNEINHYVSVFADISERKYSEKRIYRLAYYDQLTDIPNRMFFQEKLAGVISEARRDGSRFGLITLDLDQFKTVNDMWGHAVGDRLLRLVAQRLLQLPADSFFPARLGGDEFAIIWRDIDDLIDDRTACQRRLLDITEYLSQPHMINGEAIHTSVSLGVGFFPADGKDAQSLIKCSDLAAFSAKKKGRDRCEFYNATMANKAGNQVALIAMLRKAIREEQFVLHYQSKHAADDHRVVGYEALLRWTPEQDVIVGPGNFIPIAEETGLIVPIGAWVFRKVCEQAVRWQAEGFEFGRLAINISGRQFIDSGFLDFARAIIEETKVDPSRIELEITETWLMEDPDLSATALSILRDMGFYLSIDDFGIAYSSMNYLKHFPVTKIKIDRAFTRDVCTDKDTAAIIAAVVAMGQSLGITILAEGVETAEQLECLTSVGCEEVQGFYFSKPVPVDEIFDSEREGPARNAREIA